MNMSMKSRLQIEEKEVSLSGGGQLRDLSSWQRAPPRSQSGFSSVGDPCPFFWRAAISGADDCRRDNFFFFNSRSAAVECSRQYDARKSDIFSVAHGVGLLLVTDIRLSQHRQTRRVCIISIAELSDRVDALQLASLGPPSPRANDTNRPRQNNLSLCHKHWSPFPKHPRPPPWRTS